MSNRGTCDKKQSFEFDNKYVKVVDGQKCENDAFKNSNITYDEARSLCIQNDSRLYEPKNITDPDQNIETSLNSNKYWIGVKSTPSFKTSKTPLKYDYDTKQIYTSIDDINTERFKKPQALTLSRTASNKSPIDTNAKGAICEAYVTSQRSSDNYLIAKFFGKHNQKVAKDIVENFGATFIEDQAVKEETKLELIELIQNFSSSQKENEINLWISDKTNQVNAFQVTIVENKNEDAVTTGIDLFTKQIRNVQIRIETVQLTSTFKADGFIISKISTHNTQKTIDNIPDQSSDSQQEVEYVDDDEPTFPIFFMPHWLVVIFLILLIIYVWKGQAIYKFITQEVLQKIIEKKDELKKKIVTDIDKLTNNQKAQAVQNGI